MEEIGVPLNVAVGDAGGNLIAHARVDAAWMGGIGIPLNEVSTSRTFDIQTKDLGENTQPNHPFSGIHASHQRRIVFFAGGIPITQEGKVIDALGVSGGTSEQSERSRRLVLQACSRTNAPSIRLVSSYRPDTWVSAEG